MREPATSVVRRFLVAWVRADVDELAAFFSGEAVWSEGARGVHHGVGAIRKELERLAGKVPSTTVEVKAMAADGGTVLVERLDRFELSGKPFALPVSGVLEVADHSRISRWRDYYDSGSLVEPFRAAGVRTPG